MSMFDVSQYSIIYDPGGRPYTSDGAVLVVHELAGGFMTTPFVVQNDRIILQPSDPVTGRFDINVVDDRHPLVVAAKRSEVAFSSIERSATREDNTNGVVLGSGNAAVSVVGAEEVGEESMRQSSTGCGLLRRPAAIAGRPKTFMRPGICRSGKTVVVDAPISSIAPKNLTLKKKNVWPTSRSSANEYSWHILPRKKGKNLSRILGDSLGVPNSNIVSSQTGHIVAGPSAVKEVSTLIRSRPVTTAPVPVSHDVPAANSQSSSSTVAYASSVNEFIETTASVYSHPSVSVASQSQRAQTSCNLAASVADKVVTTVCSSQPVTSCSEPVANEVSATTIQLAPSTVFQCDRSTVAVDNEFTETTAIAPSQQKSQICVATEAIRSDLSTACTIGTFGDLGLDNTDVVNEPASYPLFDSYSSQLYPDFMDEDNIPFQDTQCSVAGVRDTDKGKDTTDEVEMGQEVLGTNEADNNDASSSHAQSADPEHIRRNNAGQIGESIAPAGVTSRDVPCIWTSKMIRRLILLYCEKKYKFKSDKVRKSSVWKEIAARLKPFTALQCRNKWNYLRAMFHKKREHLMSAQPGDRSVKCDFYDDMCSALYARHVIAPPHRVSFQGGNANIPDNNAGFRDEIDELEDADDELVGDGEAPLTGSLNMSGRNRGRCDTSTLSFTSRSTRRSTVGPLTDRQHQIVLHEERVRFYKDSIEVMRHTNSVVEALANYILNRDRVFPPAPSAS